MERECALYVKAVQAIDSSRKIWSMGRKAYELVRLLYLCDGSPCIQSTILLCRDRMVAPTLPSQASFMRHAGSFPTGRRCCPPCLRKSQNSPFPAQLFWVCTLSRRASSLLPQPFYRCHANIVRNRLVWMHPRHHASIRAGPPCRPYRYANIH